MSHLTDATSSPSKPNNCQWAIDDLQKLNIDVKYEILTKRKIYFME